MVDSRPRYTTDQRTEKFQQTENLEFWGLLPVDWDTLLRFRMVKVPKRHILVLSRVDCPIMCGYRGRGVGYAYSRQLISGARPNRDKIWQVSCIVKFAQWRLSLFEESLSERDGRLLSGTELLPLTLRVLSPTTPKHHGMWLCAYTFLYTSQHIYTHIYTCICACVRVRLWLNNT